MIKRNNKNSLKNKKTLVFIDLEQSTRSLNSIKMKFLLVMSINMRHSFWLKSQLMKVVDIKVMLLLNVSLIKITSIFSKY